MYTKSVIPAQLDTMLFRCIRDSGAVTFTFLYGWIADLNSMASVDYGEASTLRQALFQSLMRLQEQSRVIKQGYYFMIKEDVTRETDVHL